MLQSNCCQAKIICEDICSDCKEHCEPYDEETDEYYSDTWDDIFKMLNDPDVLIGTKEAVIRERYYSPNLKANNQNTDAK